VTAPVALPWPAGSATGIGSLPGDDPAEAARIVLGELADLPFLPELPGRGAHADLGGRGCALLADLPVDLQPAGWRLVPRPGRDLSLARDLLARDLDALEEAAAAAPPRLLKVQATGPWTLASLLDIPRGSQVLADDGAVREVAASLAEGLSRHLADLRRRLPDTVLVLQLDEPSLPAVLAGRVPTASGAATVRAPQPGVARDRLAEVLAVAEHTVVHCCAPQPPVALAVRAGAGAVAVDAQLLRRGDDDALGEALEAGVGLLLGLVPTTGDLPEDLSTTLRPARELWRRLGLPAERLPEAVVVTPACGLAGASPGQAVDVLAHCVRAAAALREEPL
jgi:methionine synthase II (cobalamin-independent)